jgi:hypothetical protein
MYTYFENSTPGIPAHVGSEARTGSSRERKERRPIAHLPRHGPQRTRGVAGCFASPTPPVPADDVEQFLRGGLAAGACQLPGSDRGGVVDPLEGRLDGHQPHAVLGGECVQQDFVQGDVQELAHRYPREVAGINIGRATQRPGGSHRLNRQDARRERCDMSDAVAAGRNHLEATDPERQIVLQYILREPEQETRQPLQAGRSVVGAVGSERALRQGSASPPSHRIDRLNSVAPGFHHRQLRQPRVVVAAQAQAEKAMGRATKQAGRLVRDAEKAILNLERRGEKLVGALEARAAKAVTPALRKSFASRRELDDLKQRVAELESRMRGAA